jgi:hypothetical protein
VRLLRVRFTIRRLIIAVVVVAVVFSISRGIGWCVLMIDRREQYLENSWSFPTLPKSNPLAKRYEEMRSKWEYAADHPWLTIEPDPPEPD